jgi:hypothetical protein
MDMIKAEQARKLVKSKETLFQEALYELMSHFAYYIQDQCEKGFYTYTRSGIKSWNLANAAVKILQEHGYETKHWQQDADLDSEGSLRILHSIRVEWPSKKSKAK